jgi:hypothetical protein
MGDAKLDGSVCRRRRRSPGGVDMSSYARFAPMALPLRTLFLLALVASSVAGPGPAGAQIQINELRIDQPGTDDDEFFELKGTASTPLTGYTLLMIGDAAGTSCGTIEGVVDLGPYSIQADGLFAGAEPTITLGGIDQIFSGPNALNFENADNVTYLLVTGFTGAAGGDIDANDDGVIDNAPWTAVIDAVAVVGSVAPNCATGIEHVYATTVLGPDGGAQPFYVSRCGDTGLWMVGDPTLGVNDTPGAPNQSCAAPPPDIQDEFRNPCVPTLNASTIVTVKARLATGANLQWKVNGGLETVTPMTVNHTSGDTTWFDGTIPGQASNGALVEYYVTATNANGADRGFDQGFFAGTTPIGSLRVNDADGLNVYRFYGARVRGNVTVPPGVFSAANMDFYVQDATGGINVFQFGQHPEQPQLGDDITVTSTLIQFNGKLEIGPDGPCDQLDVLIHGSGTPPAPIQVDGCTPPESYEGMLVKMFHVTVATGADVTWGGNTTYWGKNCIPSDSTAIFIDSDTNIDGTTITSNYMDIVGIGSQFDLSFPLTGFYELIPRGLADITSLDPLGIDDSQAASGLWLGPAVPNPIGWTAALRYRIPGTPGEEVRVRLQIVDMQGRSVATLVDGPQSPGEHRVTLDRRALRGAPGAVHFLRLEVGGQVVTGKLIYR